CAGAPFAGIPRASPSSANGGEPVGGRHLRASRVPRLLANRFTLSSRGISQPARWSASEHVQRRFSCAAFSCLLCFISAERFGLCSPGDGGLLFSAMPIHMPFGSTFRLFLL